MAYYEVLINNLVNTIICKLLLDAIGDTIKLLNQNEYVLLKLLNKLQVILRNHKYIESELLLYKYTFDMSRHLANFRTLFVSKILYG